MANEKLVLELNERAHARVPAFTAQAAIPDAGSEPGAPSGTSAGIDVADAITVLAVLALRADASTFRVVVTVTSVDDTATYTVTLGGVPFVYNAMGGDTALEILNGLQVVIDADANFNATVDATALELIITGTAEASYTHLVAATGTGALAELFDANNVDFKVWGLLKNQPLLGSTWYRLPLEGFPDAASSFITITQNWALEVRAPGMERMFIEVTTTDGQVTPFLGPAFLEAT